MNPHVKHDDGLVYNTINSQLLLFLSYNHNNYI